MVKIGEIELGEFPLLLAPMEDVSDPPFRAICKEQGADMMYTEFISVEGLIRDATKSVQKLDIYPEERPIGIQIFGANLDSMMKAAEIVEDAKPELLDINYGCPVKKVVKRCAGAGILKDIPKMVELTKAVVNSTNLPVTVKTRLGWDANSIKIDEVAERLQDVGIKALSIHGRTRQQMYKGEADWTLIGKIKENPRIHIPIFGNGDINSPEKAKAYKEKYIKHFLKTGEHLPEPMLVDKLKAVRQHLRHSVEWKGETLGILEMRRHYTNYFRGLRNIKYFRSQLVQENNLDAIFQILSEIEDTYCEVQV